MKKIFFIFFILLIASCVLIYNVNNNPARIISRISKKENTRYNRLKYRIYLLGILPVAEAEICEQGIEEYTGKRVYHFSAEAHSLKALGLFFKGSAFLDSYIDPEGLSPVLFKQRITILGRNDINKEVIYDQAEGVMSINGLRRQIFPNTQDPLSAIFNLRRIDFDKIKNLEIGLNTNQKNYILRGKFEGKNVQVNKKAHKVILVAANIQRRDNNPYHKSSISMVLWQEKENAPILIKVFASGILINARLIDAE